jgi:hypothetical protein
VGVVNLLLLQHVNSINVLASKPNMGVEMWILKKQEGAVYNN